MARTKKTARTWPLTKEQLNKMKLLQIGSRIEVLFNHENSSMQKYYKATVIYLDEDKITLLYEGNEEETFKISDFAGFTWRFSKDIVNEAVACLVMIGKTKLKF